MKKQYISFRDFFTAEDVSEPLSSVSKEQEKEAKHCFFKENYDVIGYKENNEVIGYLKKSKELDLKELDKHVVLFSVSDLIANNTSLIECLKLLQTRPYLFVIDRSAVVSIITMSDVQKPAVKMLCYGLISYLESNLAELIHHTYPHDSWTHLISKRRVESAEETFERLIKTNHETTLINCTQFYDKTDIVCDSEDLLRDYVHMSKNDALTFFDTVRDFRNDLAHAQSIAVWFDENDATKLMDTIIAITKRILSV